MQPKKTWIPIETPPPANKLVIVGNFEFGWRCGGYVNEIDEWYNQFPHDPDSVEIHPTHWQEMPEW